MIQRYLGNKASIVDSIIKEVNSLCDKGDFVCDIFAGTMSVSVGLKQAGFNVICNDINSFSYIFGASYILNNSIPEIEFNRLGLNPDNFEDLAENKLECFTSKQTGFNFIEDRHTRFNFLRNQQNGKLFKNFLILLSYLESLDKEDIEKDYRNSYFFDYYTESGNHSNYKSLRGSEGSRKFFTPENGKKIDNILNKIREWKHSNLLNEDLYYTLISVLLVSVEKISNTQGTYHDFIRDSYDPRALNSLRLIPPDFDLIISDERSHIVGEPQDSLDFIEKIPNHKALYIDPPYNFRQYTSYYFMLNLISDYCSIDDLESYFSNIQYVRGQNMENDFSSSFCKSSQFIPSLKTLVEKANTEWVIMSYFSGSRNHKSSNGNSILNEIEKLFQSDIFLANSLKVENIERTNYQSYGGHSASKVNEILYIAKKSKV